MATSQDRRPNLFRAWFSITPQEQRLLLGILAITLIGLTARYWHLRNRNPTSVPTPEAAETLAEEESP